jgi:hypothetical protein
MAPFSALQLKPARIPGDRMKRLWTIIGVANVPASFAWYQSLLGMPATAPVHQ